MDAVESDFTQILKLNNALFAEDIEQVAFSPNFKSQIAALVLSNSDIILWKAASNDGNPTMKWIPWKNDPDSKVQAIAFQPASLESISEDKVELLIITYDGTIYIINVNRILSEEPLQQSYSKLHLNASCSIPGFIPTAIVWWDSTHYRHKDIAVIGGIKGQIVFFSLTHACYIAALNTESRSPIFSLSICSDFFRDYSYLLITNDLRQQWKLLLEKEINGDSVVLLAFEENEASSTSKSEKSTKIVAQTQQKSRLQEFKQMSVETFALLKQKLNESRRPNMERPRMGSISIEHSELQSCDCYGEAFLSVQQYKNRRVLTGLFIPESVLLLYLQSKDSMTLIHHKFKIGPLVTTLLLTNTFVYVADIMETQHRILIFSTRLSESKKIEPIEYNPASFVQSFLFPEEERVISLFKMEKKLLSNEVDTTALSSTSESPHSRPGIKQIRLEDEWNEACLVVTNKGIYVISLKDNPVELAMESIKFEIGMVKKLSLIFNLSLSKVIEHLTDRLIEDKKVDEALSLCSTSRCYSGKMTLKLASMGYIDELLTYTENLLNLTDLDLPLVERIHLSNFVVTCYAEQYLRDSLNGTLHKRFMNFLKSNFHYDEEVNIHILANYKLCSFVHFLTVWRGLYFDGSIALTNLLAQSQTDKFKNVHHFDGFWQLFSEPCLVDAFVLNPRTLHLHIQFLRQHLNEIPSHILKRLYDFYDPTRPVLRPAMRRFLKVTKDEYLEAYDFQNDKWGCDANMYDWLTNFLFLHIHMYKYQNFDYALNKYVSGVLHATIPKESVPEESEMEKFPSTPMLSAGFAHAAVVRNGSLVSWGQAAYGCLGTGPTLSQNCAPALNSWFEDHKIQVKYVSCGRHHTIALTENGVYAWGSNKFGQLGVGQVGQSVYPRMVEALASYSIAFVIAGQYHSLATDISGRLWTWGWGVYGQLGHGNTDDQYYPKLVEKLKKKVITHASGGQAHSVVLTNKGKVFTFGCNTYGQLGIGTTLKSTSPVKVFGIQEKIVTISTNYFHNLVLSESNRLYTWGCSPQILKLLAQSQKRARSMQCFQERTDYAEINVNNCDPTAVVETVPYEQLTASMDNGKHLSPTLVDTTLVQEKIIQISCGLFHSALLTSNNQIYTWGRNVDGQLGNCKRQTEVSLPTPVNIFSIKLLPANKQQLDLLSRPLWKISCGKDYTLAMELENRLFGWGNNCCGQLGTLPQEDFSIKRYLNGKFIVNKYAKRMIKVSHGGINIIEKPMEIQGLPKVQLMFNNDENNTQTSSRVECDLNLPGLNQQNFPIFDTKTLFSELNASGDQVLHYFLECFHGFYNVEFILNTCAENNNYQAMSKICCLNFQFYDAFFYGLKSLLMYVRENYFFNTFKDSYGQAKNRMIPKNITKVKENVHDETINSAKKTVVFEFMEDVIMEAVYMFENFYKMILQFTPEKTGSFLRKSVSVWIAWELPLQPLEWFFSKNWDQVSYPLAVFLFCDHYKSLIPSNDQELKNSSQIESTSWKDNKRFISTYLQTKKYPLSSKTKYPFLSSTESKAYYQNLYQWKSDSHLESDDPKYKLTSTEMLQNLSVQFTLKLCNVIIDSMSMKPNAEYEEFVRLLHEVIFAPSVLKSDNRNPDEVFSAVLSTLQRSQSSRKKFIHISYDELREQPISNKFIAFSCGHYFISQSVFEKEVNTVVRELDSLRLVSTSELVNRLFSDTCYTTCCPNCLFRYVEYETH